MSDWLLGKEEIDKAKGNGWKYYISRANRQDFTDAIMDSQGDCEDRAIAKAQAKKLVEWLEAEMTRKWREIMENPKAVLPMDNSLIDWEALKKEVEDG